MDSLRKRRAARLRTRLEKGPVLVLDGAGGTVLQEQGVDISGATWSAEALSGDRGKVVGLHAAYARSGAEVHTAVTFRTHPGLFQGVGGREAWRRTLQDSVRAVEQGLQVAGVDRERVWIAGSLAPVGDCYSPGDVPPDSVLVDEHTRQAVGLLEAGVDLILVETMLMIREAQVALQAAQATGLPVWVSFVVGPDRCLLSGEPLADAVDAVVREGAQAVLVNCASLENTKAAVEVLAHDSRIPWGAYANGSQGDPQRGWGQRVDEGTYARAVEHWLDQGARIVGSCCATNPGYTRAIAQVVRAGADARRGMGTKGGKS